MRNVHERFLAAPVKAVDALLDRLGSDADPLWPTPAWPPLRLDCGQKPGSRGGHGPIRYVVEVREPGRLRCRFEPGPGLEGHHEFSLAAVPGGCLVRHVIEARLRGRGRLAWPLAIRWLHDALLEDLFDNAELAATGRPARPRRWPARTRWLHRYSWPRAVPVPIPERAALLRAALPGPYGLADAWRIPKGPGLPAEPDVWAAELFGRQQTSPGWLMRLRDRLVVLVGIERSRPDSFARLAGGPGEHLLGSDAGHLDFRASILVEPDAVTLSTLARAHNLRGRVYLAVVRRVHPYVVRRMLRGTSRRLALGVPGAGGRELDRTRAS
ncbi:DUF2867 domain-containing protein [Longispora urticae]